MVGRRAVGLAIVVATVVAATTGATAGCGDEQESDRGAVLTPEVRGALQECLREVFSNTESGDAPLRKADRATLEAECREAVDGGVPELRETAKRVCAQVVEKTVPKGLLAFKLALRDCEDGRRTRQL